MLKDCDIPVFRVTVRFPGRRSSRSSRSSRAAHSFHMEHRAPTNVEQQQPDESPKNACVANTSVRTIGAEQLRQYLNERRNRLRRERAALLQMADRIKEEIATYDQLLMELTT